MPTGITLGLHEETTLLAQLFKVFLIQTRTEQALTGVTY